MIRWKLVVHARIDNFSRLIVFLHCSSSNRASTVYGLFLTAVQQFGLPSRVRSDQGHENILVARHMLEHHSVHRKSMLTGSSIHNQRIEDYFVICSDVPCNCITICFIPRGPEPSNHQYIYALHYVYLPRINKTLKQSWNPN